MDLRKPRPQVASSAFCHLYSEMVQYFQGRCAKMADLDTKLTDLGMDVGLRLNELIAFRERSGKRETKLIAMLQFITTTVWRFLFGKTADLEKSTENNDYMIIDEMPLTNKFVSVPKQYGRLNTASYLGGIIQGMLCGSNFPCNVSAHHHEGKTVFLVKLKAKPAAAQ